MPNQVWPSSLVFVVVVAIILICPKAAVAASNSSCSLDNIEMDWLSANKPMIDGNSVVFFRFHDYVIEYDFTMFPANITLAACRKVQVDLWLDDDRCNGVIEFADGEAFHRKFMLNSVNNSANITISASELGTCMLASNFTGLDTDGKVETVDEVDVIIRVIRVPSPLDKIFNYLMMTLVMFGNIAMGLKTDIQIVISSLKRPVGPVIALCIQFFVQPLVAFGLIHAFSVYPEIVALGMFIVGCSPSGTVSNFHTYLLGGDVSLAVTVTLCSTILSLAAYPLWIYTLGTVITASAPQQPSVPFDDIALTLAECVVPVIIGLILKVVRPEWALFLLKFIVQPYLAIVIIYLLTAGIYTNLYLFEVVSWQVLVAGCLLPYVGFAVGFIVATIARESFDRRIAIFIESGLQNVYIPIFMLRQTFQQPDADLASVGPLGSLLLGPIPLYAIEIFILIRNIYRKSERFRKFVDNFVCCCLPRSIVDKLFPMEESVEDPIVESLIRASLVRRERTISKMESKRIPFTEEIEDVTRPLLDGQSSSFSQYDAR